MGAIAPVMVPMLMLLGISPEMATAAYRVGDSATNIITLLMVYFPLILIFCQRWQNTCLGSLVATMLPYSLALMIAGLAMTIGWVILDLPLGPGASVFLDSAATGMVAHPGAELSAPVYFPLRIFLRPESLSAESVQQGTRWSARCTTISSLDANNSSPWVGWNP